VANRLVLAPDLNAVVAARFGRPAVAGLLDTAQRTAVAAAPDGKTWVTMHDDRVRPTHASADGQTIPANIPFLLDKVDGSVGDDRAEKPRDPGLPFLQRVECRCETATSGVVAASIHTSRPEVVGARAHGEVSTIFERAAESEFAERGGGWMRAGLDAAARQVAPRRG
jgi:hypothetical protein